jgi:hypothetical protein
MRVLNNVPPKYVARLSIILLALFSLLDFSSAADKNVRQEYPFDMIFYQSQQWVEYENYYPACYWDGPDAYPDTIAYNTTYIFGDLPRLGYPYHKSLVEGVNDTLQAFFTLYSHSAKPFIMKNSHYEQWFAPQVYQLWVTDSKGPAFRDSTQLGYRVRGWDRYGNTKPLDTLTAERSNQYSIIMDIYDLPQEGRFQICLLPTDKVPKEFSAMPGGYVFEYYPAQSVCDSVNGYEACFWRAIQDGDREAARNWLDTILRIDPYSVPGWWMSAIAELRYWGKPDTAAAIEAYDRALKYMDTNQDPCMPDSTARPLRQAEINYLEWMRPQLEYSRQQLGE